jgi:hypothetical protein
VTRTPLSTLVALHERGLDAFFKQAKSELQQ